MACTCGIADCASLLEVQDGSLEQDQFQVTDCALYLQVIDFSPITSMYGSVHCSSQVVKRIPRRLQQQLIQSVVSEAAARRDAFLSSN